MEKTASGEGWATLEAKIIRADGTEEDLGEIASTDETADHAEKEE